MFLGLLFVFGIFALLVGGVGKIARERGRSVIVWALAAAAAGIAAFVLGLAVFQQVLAEDASTIAMMMSVLAPMAFMVAAMLGVAWAAYRAPVNVAQKNEWSVHFVKRGDGRIVIAGGEVMFVWKDGSQTLQLQELERAEADGECVRIKAGELELSVLPTGTPDSPAGRRQQSIVLARRLTVGLPKATVRATGT